MGRKKTGSKMREGEGGGREKRERGGGGPAFSGNMLHTSACALVTERKERKTHTLV